MRPTMKDIAKKAGVSKTTVSFALNDPGRISVKTYNRVMAVVAELDYVPNPVARTLTTKRLGSLGFLLPQPITEALKNPYICEIIRGIGEVCEKGELSLTILPPIRGRIIDAARQAFVDGLITIGVGPDHEVIELLNKRHIPFVTIDGAETETTVNVGVNDEAAAYGLLSSILALGHRKITILALRPETLSLPEKRFSLVSDRRLAGFARALGETGLGLNSPGIEIIPVECSLEGGIFATNELLSRRQERPTAVLAMADIVALGAYEACRSAGLSIPPDLSIAGFDDIPMAAGAVPPLTTVHQPGREKGAVAAALVVKLLAGNEAQHCCLETELVVRSSTTAPFSRI
jgi:DNA-binding LacI/PurR family transcriptional regulator